MSAVATAIVGSAVVGAVASNRAANKQVDAANRAGDLSQAQFEQNREDQTPWRDAGQVALRQLVRGIGGTTNPNTLETFDGKAYLEANPDVAADTRFGSDPYSHYLQYGKNEGREAIFNAPPQGAEDPGAMGPSGDFTRDFTLADFQKDPGYDFRLGEGRRGVEAGAAARGGALSGGALKALERYSQGYASNEFGNAYNRFNSDRDRRFNRLASIAGLGQTATRDVAQMGTDNARNQGEYGMQGANARASGYVGTANQVGTGLQTLGQWWNRSPSYTSPNRDGSYNNPAYDGSGSFNSTGTAFRDPIPYEG